MPVQDMSNAGSTPSPFSPSPPPLKGHEKPDITACVSVVGWLVSVVGWLPAVPTTSSTIVQLTISRLISVMPRVSLQSYPRTRMDGWQARMVELAVH